jgi:hypothetical protein
MSLKKYNIISDFTTQDGRVPLNDMNTLVAVRRLDDLLEWENILDARNLDYCIAYTQESYMLITDMNKFLQPGEKRSWEYGGISEMFLSIQEVE